MTWRHRAGRILLDTNGPDGQPIETTLDRRWLWRMEIFLAVNATTDDQRQLQRDLHEYLCETCEHRWLDREGDDVVAAHRQCLWCNDVRWLEGAS